MPLKLVKQYFYILEERSYSKRDDYYAYTLEKELKIKIIHRVHSNLFFNIPKWAKDLLII